MMRVDIDRVPRVSPFVVRVAAESVTANCEPVGSPWIGDGTRATEGARRILALRRAAVPLELANFVVNTGMTS
jgi:hypothetical protein